MKDFSSKVRTEVKARSGEHCEARTPHCTGHRATVMHHRQLRRFGDHSPANALHVCVLCHAYIHAHVALSYERGWLIHSWEAVA